MRILLVGAGGVGSAFCAISARRDFFESIVVADYSRSSRQAKGPINATLGVATGAVYNGLLHVTDPSIPKNSGCFRPIRVVAPPGKVVNVDYPGPLVAVVAVEWTLPGAVGAVVSPAGAPIGSSMSSWISSAVSARS